MRIVLLARAVLLAAIGVAASEALRWRPNTAIFAVAVILAAVSGLALADGGDRVER